MPRRFHFEPRVFGLLAYLVENSGRVIAREELLEKLWPDTNVTDASLSQAVASLRDALDDDVRTPKYLASSAERRPGRAPYRFGPGTPCGPCGPNAPRVRSKRSLCVVDGRH